MTHLEQKALMFIKYHQAYKGHAAQCPQCQVYKPNMTTCPLGYAAAVSVNTALTSLEKAVQETRNGTPTDY